MSKRKKIIPIITALIILAAAAIVIWAVARNLSAQYGTRRPAEAAEAGPTYERLSSTIEYNGKTYAKDLNLQTLLFMGVDSDTKAELKGEEYTGNNGRADTIVLFVVNKKDKTIRKLEIPRDTMVEVEAYDNEDNLVGKVRAQLTMQYAFSNSSARSCQLMKRKVSELLYNSDIDDYLSITLDGVSAAIDAMGGITLTFDEDYTDIDPAYTKGATVTMDADQVERFIRKRDKSQTGSNLARMDHQSWFMQELFAQLASGKVSVSTLYDAAEDYIESDVYADELKLITEFDMADERLILPGEYQSTDTTDEYIVDEDALYEMILDLFYEEV